MQCARRSASAVLTARPEAARATGSDVEWATATALACWTFALEGGAKEIYDGDTHGSHPVCAAAGGRSGRPGRAGRQHDDDGDRRVPDRSAATGADRHGPAAACVDGKRHGPDAGRFGRRCCRSRTMEPDSARPGAGLGAVHDSAARRADLRGDLSGAVRDYAAGDPHGAHGQC